MRFEDKVAVVTGAGSGIGRAVALAFAMEGASIALVDRDSSAGEAAVQAAIAAGGRAIFIEADVSVDQGAARASEQAASAFGGVDILFNGATAVEYGAVPDLEESAWDRVLDTNLKSAFLTSKRCIPLMAARGGGAVVNLGSVHAEATQPSMAAYAAAKGGLVALTRAMALDHAAQQIRVNCISPGAVDMPSTHQTAERFSSADPQAALAGWTDAVPAGRLARPEEIAAAALFLASGEASFISGAHLVVDGGLLARLM